jgi:hypothetical protein
MQQIKVIFNLFLCAAVLAAPWLIAIINARYNGNNNY